jgi:hypothetical protein
MNDSPGSREHRTNTHETLRIQATDSQCAVLQQRLRDFDGAISYQEEQHGPDLIICIRFNPEHETTVSRILEEIGLPAGQIVRHAS